MKKINDVSYSTFAYLPIVTTILLLLFSYMPFSFGFPNNIRPQLAIASCFFWLTHRSDIFGLASVFFVSFVSDSLSGTPFGSNFLVLFSMYYLIMRFETFFYNKDFITYWYGFAMFYFVAILIKWFVLSVYYSVFLPFMPVFFMYLITVICYPFISGFNAVVQKYVSFSDE